MRLQAGFVKFSAHWWKSWCVSLSFFRSHLWSEHCVLHCKMLFLSHISWAVELEQILYHLQRNTWICAQKHICGDGRDQAFLTLATWGSQNCSKTEIGKDWWRSLVKPPTQNRAHFEVTSNCFESCSPYHWDFNVDVLTSMRKKRGSVAKSWSRVCEKKSNIVEIPPGRWFWGIFWLCVCMLCTYQLFCWALPLDGTDGKGQYWSHSKRTENTLLNWIELVPLLL